MADTRFSIDTVDPDLEIDFMNLQPAVAMQSSLYGYYSDKAVDARADRDTAVNELDRMTASVELEIREHAANTGEKLTEGKVSAKVEVDLRIVALKADVVEKNRELQRTEAKVRALENKKTMIDCAVRMVLSKSLGMSMDGVTTEYSSDMGASEIRKGLNRMD